MNHIRKIIAYYFYIKDYILQIFFRYEVLSEKNKIPVIESLNILVNNIQFSENPNINITIKTNKFTSNKIFIFKFLYNGKNVIFKYWDNVYQLKYKGQIVEFNKQNIVTLKNEWNKLNPCPLSYFEA